MSKIRPTEGSQILLKVHTTQFHLYKIPKKCKLISGTELTVAQEERSRRDGEEGYGGAGGNYGVTDGSIILVVVIVWGYVLIPKLTKLHTP